MPNLLIWLLIIIVSVIGAISLKSGEGKVRSTIKEIATRVLTYLAIFGIMALIIDVVKAIPSLI